LPGSVFVPAQPAPGGRLLGDQFILAPGQDTAEGAIGRNVFFAQGMKNFDVALAKYVRIREGIRLELRMELYNAFNRVKFNMPARTVVDSLTRIQTPMGRISSTLNIQNFVNSARNSSARMGQLGIRLVF
jgi:hypothetical protein